jgi:hypothetical protein
MILFIFTRKVQRVQEAAEAGQGIIKAGTVNEVDSERDHDAGSRSGRQNPEVL